MTRLRKKLSALDFGVDTSSPVEDHPFDNPQNSILFNKDFFGPIKAKLHSSADAVPFIDDKGKPVLDGHNKPMFRPAGLPPQTFIDRGLQVQEFSNEVDCIACPTGADIITAYDLRKFRQGGEWDAQRIGGKYHPEFVDYATVAIGMYGAATGIPKNIMLSIQNIYAQEHSHYPPGTVFSQKYPSLPERNVENTEKGYSLITKNRIGPDRNTP